MVTLTVMYAGKAERIRLHGIDAPERGQAFSNRAKQFVSGSVSVKELESSREDWTATREQLRT
jgi:micrococcal nuclease